MHKKLFIIYLVCVHVVLTFLLVKYDFIHQVKIKIGIQAEENSLHYHTMVDFHKRIDKNVASDSIIFIGDSHVQGLAVSAVSFNAVNYGIGRDTTVGVIQRIPFYKSILFSKAVVVVIGFNDLKFRKNEHIIKNIKKILDFIPPESKAILCAIIPVGEKKHKIYNKRIKTLNHLLKKISMAYDNTTYLDSFEAILSNKGYLMAKYHLPDNIHLSKFGYDIFIKNLINAIEYEGHND